MDFLTSKQTSWIASLLLICGLLTPLTATAQESPLSVGVRGGLTSATFYGDDVASNDFRPGFTGGVFLNYQVNDAFAIQPEVLYSVRGSKNLDIDGTPNNEDARVRQDVIEVPVLLKLSAPLAPITPRLYVGPAIGFATNNEVDGVDADDSFADVDFSGVVGGEIAYSLQNVSGGVLDEIAVDGRYNLGLVNVGDTDAFEEASTSAFTGTLSLRFNL